MSALLEMNLDIAVNLNSLSVFIFPAGLGTG